MSQRKRPGCADFSNFRVYERIATILSPSCLVVDAHAKTDPRPARRAMLEDDAAAREMSHFWLASLINRSPTTPYLVMEALKMERPLETVNNGNIQRNSPQSLLMPPEEPLGGERNGGLPSDTQRSKRNLLLLKTLSDCGV